MEMRILYYFETSEIKLPVRTNALGKTRHFYQVNALRCMNIYATYAWFKVSLPHKRKKTEEPMHAAYFFPAGCIQRNQQVHFAHLQDYKYRREALGRRKLLFYLWKSKLGD
jgi:hypothetical protein